MTVLSMPKARTSRWAAALAEGAALTAGLCALVIAAALVSRPI